ncbi:putative transcription factor C2H2 family [Medicago truncatula]|uniref:Anaphase-promoting complex subunit 11 RING-H2 finger protein n=1 Tax=Medicago truncatula TaxID=3880 RepID=G7K8K3_MEDTR|nr:NEP1-interacting protein-like 2 [Medicago truncatula]AET00504.1 anaphase-promoting complex subunit 11 RING-H2 finger protein [Medicago truncatula]RHN57783.1 putative transcription factor C2H2 family [Medicago truncatula]
MTITITSLTMNKWFSRTIEAITKCQEVLFNSSAFEKFMKAMERFLFAAFTCILALGGSIIGTIAGAIKGQTTETGFLDGAGKGAIAGAIAAIELMSFASVAEPFSKVALLRSLLNGKVFMEWICPTVAQAYLFYINSLETAYGAVLSDIYDDLGVKGMQQSCIMKLPCQQFSSNKMMKLYNESCCSICIQDFENEELVRLLPKCSHIFHLECIDKWLVQQGSCPICRTYVPDHINS